MKIPYLMLVCALPFFFSACRDQVVVGRGDLKTEARKLESAAFSNIKIDAPVNARITIGGSPSLTLEGYANVLPYLHSEIRGNTLYIFTDEQTDLDIRENITAVITVPSLTGVDISGAVDAVITGVANVPTFKVDMSGACSVDIRELHVQSFEADLSGSASLTLHNGDIGTGSFDVSGSGDINAFGVTQRDVSLDLAGSANAAVTATGKLHVEISGSGSVKYKGHPAVTQDVSGSGSITDAN